MADTAIRVRVISTYEVLVPAVYGDDEHALVEKALAVALDPADGVTDAQILADDTYPQPSAELIADVKDSEEATVAPPRPEAPKSGEPTSEEVKASIENPDDPTSGGNE